MDSPLWRWKWSHRTTSRVLYFVARRTGDIASHILSNYYNSTRTAYYTQLEKATETKDLSKFIEYALLGFRDGLVQTLEVIQQSQFLNTWQKFIYDKFDSIRESSQDRVFRRQRLLALELPLEKFTVSQVSELSIALAKVYSEKGVSGKTMHRDVERLVDLELLLKLKPDILPTQQY